MTPRQRHLVAFGLYAVLLFFGEWFVLSQYWMDPFNRGLASGFLIALWIRPMADHIFAAIFGDDEP